MDRPRRIRPFLIALALPVLLFVDACTNTPSHGPGLEAEPLLWIPPVATPRVPSELGVLIEDARDAEDACAKTQRFLENTTDPVGVGYLLLYCHWKSRTPHWREPNEANVFGPRDRSEWYFEACSACLDRLSKMGREGNDEAIRQLVFVLTEVDHEAAFSEEIGQAFCLLGERAVPFLSQVEGRHASRAQSIIGMIGAGHTYY